MKTQKGHFSRLIFGTNKLPENAILFAGILYPKEKIQHILALFEHAEKLSDFQPVLSYRVRIKKAEWLLCFGVYGGTSALEITNILGDGGVKSIVFVGWAGARKTVPVGAVCLPITICSLDGIVRLDSSHSTNIAPSVNLLKKLKKTLPNARHVSNVTLPGLGNLHGIAKVERASLRHDTVDTELSVVVHFARKSKVSAAGVLIVTDSIKEHKETINPNSTFTQIDRYNILEDAVKTIVNSDI